MTTEINTANSPTKQKRILPEWMTKSHPCSPSKKAPENGPRKNAETGDGHITSTDIERASSAQQNCSSQIEEQEVKEENVLQVGNGITVQPKAHQLSDDEEESIIKEEEEVLEKQEEVCDEEQDKVCEEDEACDVSEEQDEVCAEEGKLEEEGSDGQCKDVASGAPSDPSSQNSNGTGIQTVTGRVLCNYGAKCYRKNPEHKKEYCHPWDADYDTVFNNLPVCQYGAGCYRKNKAHWQTHSHLPSMPPARPAKRNRKRTAKPPAATDSDLEDDDDDDSVDLFLNDASSDDYQPTDTGSDSDISDAAEGGEDDGEPDTKRMKKEAKRFLRKKK